MSVVRSFSSASCVSFAVSVAHVSNLSNFFLDRQQRAVDDTNLEVVLGAMMLFGFSLRCQYSVKLKALEIFFFRRSCQYAKNISARLCALQKLASLWFENTVSLERVSFRFLCQKGLSLQACQDDDARQAGRLVTLPIFLANRTGGPRRVCSAATFSYQGIFLDDVDFVCIIYLQLQWKNHIFTCGFLHTIMLNFGKIRKRKFLTMFSSVERAKIILLHITKSGWVAIFKLNCRAKT